MKPRRRWLFFILFFFSSTLVAQTQVCSDKQKATTPSSRFENHGAALYDQQLKKMWLRCAAGMQWNGKHCAGKTSTHNYTEALVVIDQVNRQKAGGKNTWRLPTRDELLSIVEKRCHNPAINLEVFSYSPQSGFWTSTENPGLLSTRMEIVHFLFGEAFIANKSQSWRVRLIAD